MTVSVYGTFPELITDPGAPARWDWHHQPAGLAGLRHAVALTVASHPDVVILQAGRGPDRLIGLAPGGLSA